MSELKKFKIQIPVGSSLHRRFLAAAKSCGDMPVATWARMILLEHINRKEQDDGS